MDAIAEDTNVLTLEEIASAYSQAVPPTIVARRLNCEIDDEDAIAAEREKFYQFMLAAIEADEWIYANQKEAWEVYVWDWDDWKGRKDDILDKGPSLDTSWWHEIVSTFDGQAIPGNYNEYGGQQ